MFHLREKKNKQKLDSQQRQTVVVVTAHTRPPSEIRLVEHGRLMEDGWLDEVDALGVGCPDLLSPKDPGWTPVVRYKRDGTCWEKRGGGEVGGEEEVRGEGVPDSVESPDW